MFLFIGLSWPILPAVIIIIVYTLFFVRFFKRRKIPNCYNFPTNKALLIITIFYSLFVLLIVNLRWGSYYEFFLRIINLATGDNYISTIKLKPENILEITKDNMQFIGGTVIGSFALFFPLILGVFINYKKDIYNALDKLYSIKTEDKYCELSVRELDNKSVRNILKQYRRIDKRYNQDYIHLRRFLIYCFVVFIVILFTYFLSIKVTNIYTRYNYSFVIRSFNEILLLSYVFLVINYYRLIIPYYRILYSFDLFERNSKS